MTPEQRATLRTLAIDLKRNCEEDPRQREQSEEDQYEQMQQREDAE